MIDNRGYLQRKIDSAKHFFLWHFVSGSLHNIRVAEYPKSGGTWLCQMLSAYLSIEFNRNKSPRFEKNILHGHYPYFNSDKNILIHQIRDGRDVMVSLYHHMYFGNGIIPQSIVNSYRKKVSFKNFENITDNMPAYIEYMFTKFSISGKKLNWASFINSFNNKENVVQVKYEDLLSQPIDQLSNLLIKLNGEGFQIDLQKLNNIAEQFSFEALAKRKRGQENKSNFLRKGIIGDWKNYFNKEACEVFNYYAGKELIEFGYEKNLCWF